MKSTPSKLDSALITSMASTQDDVDTLFSVFIRLSEQIDERKAGILRQVGVSVIPAEQILLTARLTRESVKLLESQPWVQRLSLAQQLRQLSAKIG